MSARRAARVAACLLALVLTVITADPAAARSGPIVVEVVGGGTLFDTDRMYPGFEMTDDIRVTNTTGEPGAIRLRVLDLVSDDAGCSPPEARVDVGCGDDEGELDEQVTIGVERLGPGRPATVTRPTTLDAVDDLLLGEVGAGETATYRLTFALPSSSGNETQTDQLSFGLEIAGFRKEVSGTPTTPGGGTGVTPDIDVDPDVAEPDPDVLGPDPDVTDPDVDPVSQTESPVLGAPLGTEELEVLGSTTSRLPRTGRDLLDLWAAGLACIGTGGVLTGLARFRRRASAD